jgi:hypothetical protein
MWYSMIGNSFVGVDREPDRVILTSSWPRSQSGVLREGMYPCDLHSVVVLFPGGIGQEVDIVIVPPRILGYFGLNHDNWFACQVLVFEMEHMRIHTLHQFHRFEYMFAFRSQR